MKRNQEKLARYLIQIGQLLEQGYPLHTAIQFMQLHVPSEMKKKFDDVLAALQEGHSVHEAFTSFDLPPTLSSFLYFFERQGKLAEGFVHAGHLLEKREKWKSDLIKLLRYPLFLLWLCFFLLLVMYSFVLPHYRSFFSIVQEIPPLTRLVYHLIEQIPNLLVILSGIFLFVLLYHTFKMRSSSSAEKIQFLLQIPFVKRYVRQVLTYYFSLQLGRLLETGLTLQEALNLFATQTYLPFFQQESEKMMDELRRGVSFPQLLYERAYFLKDFAFVVEHGEKTGYIGKDLIHYSDVLYRDLDEKMLRALKYVQPLSFLFIGAIVFLLFLATMLPLFQMISAL